MADQKKLNRIKLMLQQADRVLEQAEPDLVVFEKLIADALTLAMEMREPPNPYADKALRPGLTLSQESPDV